MTNCILNSKFQNSKFQNVGREGIEPPKAEPTGLQPVPFDRFGTYPFSCSVLLQYTTINYSLCKGWQSGMIN